MIGRRGQEAAQAAVALIERLCVEDMMVARLGIDTEAALARLMGLLKVDGVSRQEGAIRAAVDKQLRAMGVKKSWITHDDVHKHFGGEVGNLIVRLPGTGSLAREGRRFFSAHIDTVPACAGVEPVVSGRFVKPKGKTGLGADNRACVAALLAALAEVLASGVDRAPMTLVFTVAEEIGLLGARYLAKSVTDECTIGYNMDGGTVLSPRVGAPSAMRYSIGIEGIAAHAGGDPRGGVNAATVFALAVAELAQGGWLGEVVQGRREGRSNIGFVHGGRETNVVMPDLTARGEARSHNDAFLRKIVATIERAFVKAAGKVKNKHGQPAKVTFESHHDYTTFLLPMKSPAVRTYQRVAEALMFAGVEFGVGFGGLDANELNGKGLPTVTFGAGGRNPHCIGESCYLPEYYQAVAMAKGLMTIA